MPVFQIINFTPETIADYGVCGYKDVKKHKELRNKIEWYRKYYPEGLRIKAVLAEDGSYQGMLEYIPGELAHRPVNTAGYMFIHCLFVGFKKQYKGQGFASALLEECIHDAKAQNKAGVAVVTRKGSFMAKRDIFLKFGFTVVDSAKPDFELLVLKFVYSATEASFRHEVLDDLSNYQKGLTIMRSVQCPYTEKNVKAILATAKTKYNLKTNLFDINDAESAQQTPCAFGTFCMIYEGKVISHHPISNGRFVNIMGKILGK